MHVRRATGRRWGWLIGAVLLAAAAGDQLRRPASERTWEGRLGGFLPYDLRLPTLARLRAALWAPDDPHLLQPRALGVGWDLNIGRVARLLRLVG